VKVVGESPQDASGVLYTVEVNTRGGSYPIQIGYGTLAGAGAEIARRTKATMAAVVSVPPVGRRYAAPLLRSLRESGLRPRRIEVPDGDASKNLRQVARLYDALLDAGADRSSVVIALGGGVVGDLAGFTAATYLRGIQFVQVPTTLLAMVDASVGGKVGVNLPRGKNLVGAFHQPALVWVDAKLLSTLPPRQRAAGLAEVIKAGALFDAALFARLERDAERLLELEPEALLPVLERACAIKAEIVSRDEREADLRTLLNLGHTLAHAIEALSRYRGVLHGEAVAMGMVFAAVRSEELGLAPEGTALRIRSLCERFGLPTQLPGFDRRAYLDVLRVDKKRQDARIRFVALRGIGKAETVPLTPAEVLPAASWRRGVGPRKAGRGASGRRGRAR
jgi:3-dehydroquinate synthase